MSPLGRRRRLHVSCGGSTIVNSNTFRPAVLAIAAAPVALLVAVPAQAAIATTPATGAGGHGKASAVVLRAGLDVSLLSKSVRVPLTTTLNEVHGPARPGAEGRCRHGGGHRRRAQGGGVHASRLGPGARAGAAAALADRGAEGDLEGAVRGGPQAGRGVERAGRGDGARQEDPAHLGGHDGGERARRR